MNQLVCIPLYSIPELRRTLTGRPNTDFKNSDGDRLFFAGSESITLDDASRCTSSIEAVLLSQQSLFNYEVNSLSSSSLSLSLYRYRYA
mmetsp:Transcript_20312/g.30770  ORF Transcript_20312/g.30770 Transcript_20312/m.30770 type:complete len:89 (-) Transcript_20312:26-292(-)